MNNFSRFFFFSMSNVRCVCRAKSFICDNIRFFFSFQLVLRHNRLRYIPKELARLVQLKELHIQQNQINVLPPAFGE